MLTRLHDPQPTTVVRQDPPAAVAPEDLVLAPPPRSTRHWLVAAVLGLLLAGGALAAAVAMTGPAPAPEQRSMVEKVPPPLVVRDGAAPDSDIATGAQLLADGRHDEAAAHFAAVLAQDPQHAEAQVGAVLANWEDAGPADSVAALQQMATQRPRHPYLHLSVGVALAWLGDREGADEALRTALRLGSAVPEDRDVARRADDLLHPGLAPGYPPLVVTPGETRTAPGRAFVTAAARLLQQGDREGARQLVRDTPAAVFRADRPAAVAALVASYDKDRPQDARSGLTELAERFPGAPDVLLHRGLLYLWQGDRETALADLRIVARDPSPHYAGLARQLLASFDERNTEEATG